MRPKRLVPLRGVLLCALASAAVALAFETGVCVAHDRAWDPPERGARARPHTVAYAHESIIGGTQAHAGSFPSLAYVIDIQGQFAYQCTGTVVAPSLVLTAGHCVANMRTGASHTPSGFRIVTGAVDPLTPGAIVSTVLGVIVYPGFARKVDKGDAALLVLSHPVTAPAIALATPSDIDRLKAGTPAVMAGWGLTSFAQRLPTETL
ncbi:MAG TPA: trypsin-like serine protease, partial [Solirubrobacteraceae bacterium]|nr:trypsin-like serine protease [Solirubrobacteraceae bacterium]